MKYLGKGFLFGIPARDLTEAEAKEYGTIMLLKSGLYQMVVKVERKYKSKHAVVTAEV